MGWSASHTQVLLEVWWHLNDGCKAGVKWTTVSPLASMWQDGAAPLWKYESELAVTVPTRAVIAKERMTRTSTLHLQ